MEHDILVQSLDNETIVIGFTNSNGEIEYSTYTFKDGGCIGDPDSDIGAILASEAGLTEYQDYELHEL